MNPREHTDPQNPAVDAPADETAAELRAAIRAEDYQAAGRLVAQLTEALATRPALSIPGEGSCALAETMNLLLWAKKMVLANRSHLQAKLSKVERAARYKSARGTGGSRTWLMHG
jgi:hypothetical protein